MIKEETSEVKPRRERTLGPLLPFQELVNEASTTDLCVQDKECNNFASEDCTLPAPEALLHVTSRRKALPRARSLPMVCICLFCLYFAFMIFFGID